MMRRSGWMVLCALLVSAGDALSVQLSAPVAVQAPLGLVAAVIVPGVLGFAAIRGRRPRSLMEAAICLAASVGLLIGLGVLLNVLPGGLNPLSWSLALLALSVVLGYCALLRLGVIPGDEVGPPAPKRPRSTPGVLVVISSVLVCGALLTVSALVTWGSQRNQIAEQRLTELSLSAEPGSQRVHVANLEGRTMTYRLVVTAADGRPRAETFTLQDGQEWNTLLAQAETSPQTSGPRRLLSVSLYRDGDSSVYREVHLNRAPA